MENNIEIKKEEQNNLTQTTKPPKKRKAVRTVALALCCSLVGSALGAGSVLAVDRFLVKPTTSIGRINDGDQMPGDTNNSFRRPGQMPGSGNSSENSDFNGNQGQNNNSQGMQAPPDNSGRNSMMPVRAKAKVVDSIFFIMHLTNYTRIDLLLINSFLIRSYSFRLQTSGHCHSESDSHSAEIVRFLDSAGL